MNLSDLDLNLLVVLHTVLTEGSATRAAARLHVTQSAVSNALARLRGHFGDPLVVRRARGLVPTPRGAQLAPQLEAVLEQLRGMLAAGDAFDPARSTRRFTVACLDVIEVTLLPALAALFARRLPHARLRVVTLDQLVATDGLVGGDVDLLVGIPPVLPAGCAAENVYVDEMVSVVRRDHPRVGARLTLDVFAALPHVEVAVLGDADAGRIDRALARVRRTRTVALTVPHFATAPMIVAGTDAIATLSRRLAEAYAALLPLRLLAPPIELPGLPVRQVWHTRTAADAGVRLLRALVREAARVRRPRRAR